MKANGESWDDVEHMEITEAELDTKFDCGYGGAEGCPFYVWTKNRVYFPYEYDGSETVDSASRAPNAKRKNHGNYDWPDDHPGVCE
jgi:hypothetical protein